MRRWTLEGPFWMNAQNPPAFLGLGGRLEQEKAGVIGD